jgi:hypothetical protein
MPLFSRKNKSKSRNHKKYTSPREQLIVQFLVVSNMIKLFHWKTHSYAAHKASDELFSSFNDNMDKFVEILLGKMNGERFDLTNVNTIPLIDFPIHSSIERMKKEIYSFKHFLVHLEKIHLFRVQMTNSDLLNIRDEILGSLNQFLYLLTLK